MKSDRILNNLGNVDDKYIEEAAIHDETKKTRSKSFWIKCVSIAAGFVILTFAAFSISTFRLGGANSAPQYNNSDSGIKGEFNMDTDSAPADINNSIGESEAIDNATTNETPGSSITGTDTLADEYGGSQKLIKTVDLTMETKEFDKCINAVNQKVAQLGGYTENFEIRGRADSNSRYVSATLRIPSDKIDEVQDAFEDIATITRSTESKKDVTLSYVDIESRLKALRTEQDTLIRLLENASALSDIIAIQSQLTSVRYQIESYESRLRLLQNKISYSTVNISIREVYRESIVNPSFGEAVKDKFADSIDDIISLSTDFAIWFIGSIPYFVIIGILAAIIIAIIVAVKRHRKKKRSRL